MKFRLFAIAFLLLATLVPAWAQSLPEPPANSYLAFRLLPSDDPSQLEELKGHPLFRLVTLMGQEAFGIRPLEFFDETFQGTVVGALLSQGDGVTVRDFIEDRSAREDWTLTEETLHSFFNEVRDRFETEESYPESLDEYIEQERYYPPTLADGVSYRYELLEGGREFRITADFGERSDLAKLGEIPTYSSTDTEVPIFVPTAEPVPVNFVLGVKLKNSQQLKKMMTEGLGEAKAGFWSLKEEEELHLTFRGDWLVCSDRKANLGPFLKSLNGKEKGWSKSQSFQKVARNIDSEAPLFVYFDSQEVLQFFVDKMGLQEKRLASLAGPVGYSIVPYEKSQVRVEVFLGVNAPEGSELSNFMKAGATKTPTAALKTSNIPWDVSNVFAVDFANAKKLLDGGVALFPEADTDYQMGQDVVAGMLGLDAELGINGLAEGNAIVCFERIDIVLNAVESSFDTVVKLSKMTEEEQEEEVGPESPLARVPFTFAFQVPSAQNREALLKLLKPQMGEETTVSEEFGVKLISDKRGLMTYAEDGNWLYFSGGRTDRLLRHMLSAAYGRKQTLDSLDSWSRFSIGSRGHLLAYGHQKVDPFYSILKGFLLMLGSDFRPIATELGRLRDYHSVMTIVPDGILAVGEILEGDER